MMNRSFKHKTKYLFFTIVLLTVFTIFFASNHFYSKTAFYDTSFSIQNTTLNTTLNSTIFQSKQSSSSSNQCSLIPPNLGSRININLTNMSMFEIESRLKASLPELKLGGHWSPSNCTPRHRVAIIVPYRDRDYNLQLFLPHMHSFLSKQQLEYAIYLVEPIANITFNRGLLMNIGFVEALKDNENKWQCFVFHDVDLLPEDERNIYSCPETPRHMSSAVSTLKYRLPYDKIFGGVTEFTREQYEKINGFSNIFFGWGGEGRLVFYLILF